MHIVLVLLRSTDMRCFLGCTKYPVYCLLKEVTKSVSHHCVCLMHCVQEVAGLKEEEEDLSTDTDSSSHTAGTGDPSKIVLSESQYTHVHKLTGLLLYTGIDDLAEITTALEDVNNWLPLGLQLGLRYKTLERIGENKRENIDKCKTEMLVAWLQQQANPCCADLKEALKKIGQNRVASEINP